MTQQKLRDSIANAGTFAAIFLFVVIVAAFIAALLGAKPGEVANALGAVIGGTIGAGGAAAAVYLTLRIQREDESKKATEAILSEIAELAKFPIGQLGACGKAASGEMRAPMAVLPQMMHTPQAVIYPAVADRIARLPNPTLVVSFYNRIQETRGVVAVITTSAPPNVIVSREHIAGLADLLISQCQLARMILDSDSGTDHAAVLAVEMRKTMMKNIDEQLEIAKQVFPEAESFRPENSAGTPGSAGLKKV